MLKTTKPMCVSHEAILVLIIVGAGSLAGATNYLFYYYKGLASKKWEAIRYVMSGIGAAILVPLLLNMLSSNLIKSDKSYDTINYFVFAGFCFIAGYFSDRFISSIGEKILKDIENTKARVEQVSNDVRKNEKKIDLIVSTESEADEEEKLVANLNVADLNLRTEINDEDIGIQINNVTKSLNGEFKFRTIEGIAKELKYNNNIVKTILGSLESAGAVKRYTTAENKELWALTNVGSTMASKLS